MISETAPSPLRHILRPTPVEILSLRRRDFEPLEQHLYQLVPTLVSEPRMALLYASGTSLMRSSRDVRTIFSGDVLACMLNAGHCRTCIFASTSIKVALHGEARGLLKLPTGVREDARSRSSSGHNT